jgi:DNA-directed RNA polymerase subunit M/transcription elongation factor TFIIS
MSLDQKIRDENIKILKDIFKKNKISKKLDNLAKEIEEGIHNFSYDYAENNNTLFLFESIYSDKFEKMKCLLNTSKYIIDSLKEKKINPRELAFLKPEELNPDKYADIITKKEIEEFKKSNQATTDAYKCPKCKQRKCSVEEKQTRSGDEPATVYVECKNPDCGYKFHF